VDDAVVFHPLAKDQIMDIARIQLHILQDRLKETDICIQFDNDALEFLTDVGYDPVYGARPLKRAIQRHLENPLAQEILSGRYKPGDKIIVGRAGEELAFSVA
jgi:ATP-dependent Clp protease ATP-binding subunit ClpB